MKTKNTAPTFARGLLLFGAGLIAGFLSAPKSGRGTRSWINQKGDHWRAQGRDVRAVLRRRAHYEEGRLTGAVYKIRRMNAEPDEGKYVDEDLITQRVRTRIGEDKLTSMIPRINVDTGNGIVTLRGGVHSEQDRQNLERVAASVPGVEGIVNKVIVLEEATGGA